MKESSRNAGEIQKLEITKSALGVGRRQTLHQEVETDEELHGWVERGRSTNTRPSETDRSEWWRRCKLDPQANTATN